MFYVSRIRRKKGEEESYAWKTVVHSEKNQDFGGKLTWFKFRFHLFLLATLVK